MKLVTLSTLDNDYLNLNKTYTEELLQDLVELQNYQVPKAEVYRLEEEKRILFEDLKKLIESKEIRRIDELDDNKKSQLLNKASRLLLDQLDQHIKIWRSHLAKAVNVGGEGLRKKSEIYRIRFDYIEKALVEAAEHFNIFIMGDSAGSMDEEADANTKNPTRSLADLLKEQFENNKYQDEYDLNLKSAKEHFNKIHEKAQKTGGFGKLSSKINTWLDGEESSRVMKEGFIDLAYFSSIKNLMHQSMVFLQGFLETTVEEALPEVQAGGTNPLNDSNRTVLLSKLFRNHQELSKIWQSIQKDMHYEDIYYVVYQPAVFMFNDIQAVIKQFINSKLSLRERNGSRYKQFQEVLKQCSEAIGDLQTQIHKYYK